MFFSKDKPYNNMMRIPTWAGKIHNVLWAMCLLALPVSSFPFFPRFFGESAQVRPLALYPLLVIGVLVIIPRLLCGDIPRTLIPFLVFSLAALISTLLALTRGIRPPIGISVSDRTLTTWVTLVLGGLFYFSTALFPRTEQDLKFTLTWLYAGFFIALVWASFQILYILRFDQDYFDFLNKVQSVVSIRKLFDRRISGMTYEPSWFAEQLSFVLMPFLFSSVLKDYSVFRWRYKRLTTEMVLLVWATVALLFTYSRGGLAVFWILLIFSLGYFIRRGWLLSKNKRRYFIKIALLLILLLILLGIVVYVTAQKNNYFSRLWTYWTDPESEGTYLYYIAFSQRFIHWETAYRIFMDHPWLGIGLGNYTFYFHEYLPDRHYRNPEIYMKLVPEEGRNQVVTVKNFLIRILVETGLLGLSAFLAFMVALVGCVLYLLHSTERIPQFWGIAGLLGLIAFIVVTLSVDSFAIPNMWVVFGLITASMSVFIDRNPAELKDGEHYSHINQPSLTV